MWRSRTPSQAWVVQAEILALTCVVASNAFALALLVTRMTKRMRRGMEFWRQRVHNLDEARRFLDVERSTPRQASRRALDQHTQLPDPCRFVLPSVRRSRALHEYGAARTLPAPVEIFRLQQPAVQNLHTLAEATAAIRRPTSVR